jgi:hypothetical protein
MQWSPPPTQTMLSSSSSWGVDDVLRYDDRVVVSELVVPFLTTLLCTLRNGPPGAILGVFLRFCLRRSLVAWGDDWAASAQGEC